MEILNVNDVMCYCVAPIFTIAYLFNRLLNEFKLSRIKKDIINLGKFILFAYGSSPILNSLTESISSDTIYAGSSFMLFLNLIFHEYDSPDLPMVSKTLSFNAALFASVCLASRFNTSSFHTFSLITLAFILFALWPEYRNTLKVKFPKSVVILTVSSLLTCSLMFPLAALDGLV